MSLKWLRPWREQKNLWGGQSGGETGKLNSIPLLHRTPNTRLGIVWTQLHVRLLHACNRGKNRSKLQIEHKNWKKKYLVLFPIPVHRSLSMPWNGRGLITRSHLRYWLLYTPSLMDHWYGSRRVSRTFFAGGDDHNSYFLAQNSTNVFKCALQTHY